MKEVNKLAAVGWWKAMIHQGTLSLILTLDDFLISGPHLSIDFQNVSTTNPNIFLVPNKTSMKMDEMKEEQSLDVGTYFVLRPHIRGILYGLNPLYQISLYVPCKDPYKISLYQELISKIDIGGQFFQDRIYWNFETLKGDIMDARLACLIHSRSFCLTNDWLKKISIESKPFSATMNFDLTKSDHLFDLVEIRSFLEDVHQRYFSILAESKRVYVADMIRLHVDEQAHRNSDVVPKTGFFSTNSKTSNNNFAKTFNSEGHSFKIREIQQKRESLMFNSAKKPSILCGNLNTNALLTEYEDILQEQLKINHEISRTSDLKSSFAKTLCRWNTITQRKSDILKLLMNQAEKENIHKRLNHLNSVYCLKKFQCESEISSSVHSAKSSSCTQSTNNNYLIISEKLNNNEIKDPVTFTTWYSKEIEL